ncbi:hypothetical protein L596_007067 [Steinernema carpocapsae]|uniref:Uncharacterized protein n=1 Tax=Steinernema carpocapsae TaxID=34508 RepID=A0A4U5P8U7_STECR|nr:hypothetical protein L596_007067 [Steinernema carpocapsae]
MPSNYPLVTHKYLSPPRPHSSDPVLRSAARGPRVPNLRFPPRIPLGLGPNRSERPKSEMQTRSGVVAAFCDSPSPLLQTLLAATATPASLFGTHNTNETLISANRSWQIA